MSFYGFGGGYEKLVDDCEDKVISSVLLTVSEGKRLIAKAVAKMPVLHQAMNDGMVIVCKGTTNSYVAEELVGKKLVKGSFVLGRIYPGKGGKKLEDQDQINELVFIDGKQVDMPLEEAVQKLKAGDVVIKGANLLDYKNNLAGIDIGSPTAGTAGVIMPYVIARRAELIIPIGLEKLVAGDLNDIAARLNSSTPRLDNTPAVFPVSGNIITEIEAVKLFAHVQVYETACGGIGGQEGGRWLAIEGTHKQVSKALEAVESVCGEPPFVE